MTVGSPFFEPMGCSSGGIRVVAYFIEAYHCDLPCEEKYTENCW